MSISLSYPRLPSGTPPSGSLRSYLRVLVGMDSARKATTRPALSVVVPVHGVERYLTTCIDSILAQTSKATSGAVEVIAVDDASPDRCGQILDEYAQRDCRVTVVHMPTNVGLGPARNAGLDRARGDFVWFVDGDDWLPSGAVPAVLERLAMTDPDVLIVDHAEVADEGSPLSGQSKAVLSGLITPIRLTQRPELLRLAQSACTKVVRRAFLTEIGLRFRPGWYEDCAYSHPLLMAAARIDALDKVCYCYRRGHQGGITKTTSRRHFEVFDQYEWLFEVVEKSAGAYDEFRPELFRLMINHYLVIVGNRDRVPPDMRREFFRRIVDAYQRWLPANGYPVPGGVAGFKHFLVRHNAYRTYAALRAAYQLVGRVRRMPDRQRRLAPSS